jgi:hypothetical protein
MRRIDWSLPVRDVHATSSCYGLGVRQVVERARALSTRAQQLAGRLPGLRPGGPHRLLLCSLERSPPVGKKLQFLHTWVYCPS